MALLLLAAGPLSAQMVPAGPPARTCASWSPSELAADPTEAELRCRWGITGPGRFGLLSYADVPVYQPATPMPGTHTVGIPGHAAPRPGESYEAWEWRVLRTRYGAEARVVHRSLELLDPFVASRIIRFERELEAAEIRATRRETWRSPARQAYLFQQGRSRPGPLATATLTSWHSQVDANGAPAGRAVDYDVPAGRLAAFHEIATALGLSGFGADSNDPGHVFVPEPGAVDGMEIVLLRLLPRVPEVTLSTGLPVDRPLLPGGMAALRAAVEDYVTGPLLPARLPWGVVAPRTGNLPIVVVSAGPGGNSSSAADGARGGPPRGGARATRRPSRSRGDSASGRSRTRGRPRPRTAAPPRGG